MPGAIILPQKRVLGDSTKAHNNASNLPSPTASKRRKLDAVSAPGKLNASQKGTAVKFGSSQPKSQFEEEVLEKLTQGISGLKHKNSEKDQQWDRPGLADFNEKTDSLCFQQIEVEEGTLNGGRATIKLFGVTEASIYLCGRDIVLTNILIRPAILFFCTLPTSSTTFTSLLLFPFKKQIARATNHSLRHNSRCTTPPFILCKWCFAKISLDFRGIRKAPTLRLLSRIQNTSTNCGLCSKVVIRIQITRAYGKGLMGVF